MILSPLEHQVIESIQSFVYRDSQEHGLMNKYEGLTDCDRRKFLSARILTEVTEAYHAASNLKEYADELADIIIMTMVSAAREGIDIAGALDNKMYINRDRPYLHGKKEEDA